MKTTNVIVVCDNPVLASKAFTVIEGLLPGMMSDEAGLRTQPQFLDVWAGEKIHVKFYSTEPECSSVPLPVWDPAGFDATPLEDPVLILSLHCKKKFNSVLTEKYQSLAASGWSLSDTQIQQEVCDLLGGAARRFIGGKTDQDGTSAVGIGDDFQFPSLTHQADRLFLHNGQLGRNRFAS